MKKVLCVIVALLFAVSMFTGCQKKEVSKYQQILDAGELVVGTSPDYPPYEFIIAGDDGEMQYAGIDMDIAQAIADAMGVKLKIEAMDFDGLTSALQMGTIDMILAAYDATEERAAVMSFSDVYYIDTVVALVKAENTDSITDLSSFSGKKVGVQLGTTLESVYFPQLEGAEKVALKKVTQLVTELKAGALDGILVEEPIAKAYIANNPELAVSAVSFDTGVAGYVAGMPKDATEFIDAVNKVIADLTAQNAIAGFAETAQDIQDQAIMD